MWLSSKNMIFYYSSVHVYCFRKNKFPYFCVFQIWGVLSKRCWKGQNEYKYEDVIPDQFSNNSPDSFVTWRNSLELQIGSYGLGKLETWEVKKRTTQDLNIFKNFKFLLVYFWMYVDTSLGFINMSFLGLHLKPLEVTVLSISS